MTVIGRVSCDHGGATLHLWSRAACPDPNAPDPEYSPYVVHVTGPDDLDERARAAVSS